MESGILPAEGLAETAAWLTSVAQAGASRSSRRNRNAGWPHLRKRCRAGFNVYVINPKHLDRLRDRFSPAGAKDDSRDLKVQRCPRLPRACSRRAAVDCVK